MIDMINEFCLKLYLPNNDCDLLFINYTGQFIDYLALSEFLIIQKVTENTKTYIVQSRDNKRTAIYFDPLIPETFNNGFSEKFSLCLNYYLDKVFNRNSKLHQSNFYSHNLLKSEVDLIDKNSKILNLACGNCFEENIFELPFEFYFADIVDYSNYSSAFKISNANSLNFEDEYFNFIWMFYLLEHVPNPYSVIDEALKKTNKNGELWITIPVYSKPFNRLKDFFIPIFHLQVFTKIDNGFGFPISKIIDYLSCKAKIIKLEYFDFDEDSDKETTQLLLQCKKL
ncbi:MAG: methyltransferase domain-containing protein [Bacteroidia bacterium]|nr:methyltransferase domain-containing protein [Bacteroidia bacterium]